jgi:hypothetical protein
VLLSLPVGKAWPCPVGRLPLRKFDGNMSTTTYTQHLNERLFGENWNVILVLRPVFQGSSPLVLCRTTLHERWFFSLPPPFDRNLRPEKRKNKTVLEEAFGQSDVPEAIGRN